jgi:hypothetical protein
MIDPIDVGGYVTITLFPQSSGANATTFVDGYLTPPAPGQCGVRFGHLALDAPPVDVWVNGKIDLRSVSFLQRQPGNPAVIASGSAVVALALAGVSPPAFVLNSTVVCGTGEYETVWAVGYNGGGSERALRLVSISDNTPE